MQRTRSTALLGSLLLALSACSEPVVAPDAIGEACNPGVRVACECSGGAISSEVCGPAGRYLACECATPDGTVPTDAVDVRDASGPIDAARDASGAADGALDVALDGSLDAAFDATIDVGRDVSTDGCVRARCPTTGCGLIDDGCGGVLSCACTVTGILPGRLVWDAPRALAYVTVRQSSTRYPNTVIAYDPSTSSVYWVVPVGADPFPISLADDGRTAWVGLVGANAVRRFDVTTFAVEAQNTLPSGRYAQIASPVELAPIPGSPSSVFVSMQSNGSLYGSSANWPAQVIMDDAIPRGGVITWFDGNAITAGPSGLVYGFDNISTGYAIVVMEIGARGLTGTSFSGLVSGFGTTIRYGAGRVFASNGTVLDVTTDPRVPRVATTLPRGFVYVDPPSGYGYLLAQSPCRLSRFALDSYTVDQQVSCSGIRNGTIADLTRVGPGRYMAVGMADTFGTPSALYTLDAPF